MGFHKIPFAKANHLQTKKKINWRIWHAICSKRPVSKILDWREK